MDELYKADPEVYEAIIGEANREHENLELIASENFVSRAVLEAMGNMMTNKYAEGYPGKRYYGGCEFVDDAEELARQRAMKLFDADHAMVAYPLKTLQYAYNKLRTFGNLTLTDEEVRYLCDLFNDNRGPIPEANKMIRD